MCVPFGREDLRYMSIHCIELYRRLAEKMGSAAVLLHMPASPKELANFPVAIEMMRKKKIDLIDINLETVPLTKEMQKRLGLTAENAFDVYCNLIDEIFKIAPECPLVVDTAHLFACGLNGLDQVKFLQRYRSRITWIHLNGVCSPMFAQDIHTPICKPGGDNKLTEIDEIMKEIVGGGYRCIAENNKRTARRDEWEAFAAKYGMSIVEHSSIFAY